MEENKEIKKDCSNCNKYYDCYDIPKHEGGCPKWETPTFF